LIAVTTQAIKPETLQARIRDQLKDLAARLGVPVEPVCVVFDALAAFPERDGRTVAGRRFSAIQRDGVPFEWSVSVGPAPGGLRFLVDPGSPGLATSVRARKSLDALKLLLEWLQTPKHLAAEAERAIRALCPPDDLLDRALMGIWIGVGVDATGRIGFKVYVNQEPHDPSVAYLRLAALLVRLDRLSALQQLQAFLRTAQAHVTPRGIAVELLGGRIGRVKLYMRTREASSEFLVRAGEAVGCEDVVDRLAMFDNVLNGGAAYDPRVLTLSVEFPRNGYDTCLKVDVNCIRFFESDQAVDKVARQLLTQLAYGDDEYNALLAVTAPFLSAERVDRFTWLGTALREGEQRVNVYLHPGLDQ